MPPAVDPLSEHSRDRTRNLNRWPEPVAISSTPPETAGVHLAEIRFDNAEFDPVFVSSVSVVRVFSSPTSRSLTNHLASTS
jgi:hypothetical protein